MHRIIHVCMFIRSGAEGVCVCDAKDAFGEKAGE